MLTETQTLAVFTNIEKSYTIGGNSYTAFVTDSDSWDGVIASPVITLNYIIDPVLMESSVGVREERDYAVLSVDIYSYMDHVNGIQGIRIAKHIARELLVWFKQSFDAALIDNGLKVLSTKQAINLSDLEEKISRMRFEVHILYKLI